MAWLRFQKRRYAAGGNTLLDLVARIPKATGPGASYPPSQQQIFTWIGQLREFAATAEEPNHRLSDDLLGRLDAAVAEHGSEAEHFYQEGRDHSRDGAGQVRPRNCRRPGGQRRHPCRKSPHPRRRLVNYAEFPVERYVQEVLAGLDQG